MTLMKNWKRRLAGIASPAILLATIQSQVFGQSVPLPEPQKVISTNGKIDSPLEVVFGKIKIPSSTPDGPQTIGVRAYALPDGPRTDIRVSAG